MSPLVLILIGCFALFPLGDDNSGRVTQPYVTYALIAANVAVFVFLQGFGTNQTFTSGYAVVPYEIVTGHDLVGISGPYFQAPGPHPVFLTIFTAMFMHGSLVHIGGNMLFLWIFGDNIEDIMGHGRFLAFYLLCGVIATLTYVAFDAHSKVPSLGASGAIAGVLGGYLLMFPTRSVRVLFGYFIVRLPAVIVIGLWALLQFSGGFGTTFHLAPEDNGGVAYMAHVGGFIAGMLLVRPFIGMRTRLGR